MSGSAFWDDLAKDLEDPEFRQHYLIESVRIATIDEIVNALDEAREAAGMTKAELARAIDQEPAVVRRLFSAGHVNPTLGTLAEVATALGLKITVEPLSASERKQTTDTLLKGRSANTRALAKHLSKMRRPRRRTHAAAA